MYNQENKEVGFFSCHGRANRTEFLKMYIPSFFFEAVNVVYLFDNASITYMIVVLVISYIMLIIFFPLTIRRLHDSNLDWGYVIVGIISIPIGLLSNYSFIFTILSAFFGILNLYLLFRKGDPATNNYGVPSPQKKYSQMSINMICIGILVLTIFLGIIRKSI